MVGKKEAAEFLGVSTRTLERQVTDGKLSVRYEPGATNNIAMFDEDELANLKAEREVPRIKPQLALNTPDRDEAAEIVSTPSMGLMGGFLTPFTQLVERLITALTERDGEKKPTSDTLRGKYLFTLAEAQIVTGLSRELLMTAIKNGELSTRIMGKSYRIKPEELKEYIQKII